ncbi:dna2 [[Candida] subhashii]|uniref:DNA replication ATP-dependent helicase/nuclease DNA2 n=1 Tax=[Candida] subhashii TaxID=561895 RepID=A0A8J5UL33_9ASCO|nr:dna2 [[Candida] subhashii]KAG7662477.1 dna2 [[Candida] subhashii]
MNKDTSTNKRLGPSTTTDKNNNHESIQPVKRPKKISYFQPVNRLTNTTTTAAIPSVAQVIKPIDPNTFNSIVNPVQEVSSTQKRLSASNNENKLGFLIPDQSSDDTSFDGVRWKESPKTTKLHRLDKIPSSPLKSIAKSTPSIVPKQSDESVNEQTSHVLSKYGIYDARNNVTKPVSKAHSDLSYQSHQTKHKNSQCTTRSKSCNNSSKPTSLSGTLRNWIDKFEHSPTPTNDATPITTATEATTPATTNIEDNLFSTNDNRSSYSDDPFSDDDSELVHALHKMTQAVPSSPIQESPTKKASPSPSSISSFSDSDDPFSDDDSELMAVIRQPTQNPPRSASTPISPIECKKACATSGPAISATQAQFTKSFQEGMKNFEQLQIEKPSYEQRDEPIVKLAYKRSSFKRYMITKIIEQTYGTPPKRQLILETIDGENEEKICRFIVRGEYSELEFEPKDIIHIIITEPSKPNLIDDHNNLLIWNPDILLSVTTIAQQIICPRKSVIQARYKFPAQSSIPIIVGEVTHRIFQECVISENWTREYMNQLMEEYVHDYLLAIFSIGPELANVKTEIEKHLPYLEEWFSKYYKKPLSKENYIDEDGTNKNKEQRVMFSVDEALDIEENIWSPMFGIKGKVDITVTAKLLNKNTQGKFLIPVEIKTGREYVTHQAQASLYSLLFKDRYDLEIMSFLLVYTKESLTKKGDINKNDLKVLINLRNRVSQYFKDNASSSLPPILQSATCDRCDMQEPCMTLNHLLEDGTKEHSGINEEKYHEITKHILDNERYKTFFKYWDEIIAQEEVMMSKTGKQLWTMTSAQREAKTGKCLGSMMVVNTKESPSDKVYEYTFAKSGSNALTTQLIPSDRIIISDEDGHFAIASGTIKTITKEHIVIVTKRRIIISKEAKLKHFNQRDNQVFQSALRETSHSQQEHITSSACSNKLFRLDLDEMFYGMGLARFNILNLFLRPEIGGDEKTRKLIVDLQEPTYSPNSWQVPQKKYFNVDQIMAFQKVFTTNDYSLILGMPGTGKTTVLAELIRILVGHGKTILLASYTNSAVDNILLKLLDLDPSISMVRIGHKSRVQKKLHAYIPDVETPITTYEQYLETYMNPPIVATTCLGINDLAFQLRPKFDYCIVDEASQVSLPINLGPLRYADKFILVGDHYQLPPLVQHPDPKIRQGLSVSLFKLLAETYPESVCELTYQYRMCEDIMQLSNVLVYDNRLKCGSEAVAKQVLKLPYPDRLPGSKGWMNDVLDPEKRVLFLDHDMIESAKEVMVGDMVQNPIEAKLIHQIVNSLTGCGVTEDQIGIMSFYRAQLKLLKRTIGRQSSEIEILTADQYQGRDKECIIISLVRSNEEKRPGDLIKEWRRLNVAITRAKSKLIILGSRSTLSSADTTSTFIDFLENRGWYYLLPNNADLIYNDLIRSVNSSPRKNKQNRESQLSKRLLERNPILNNVIQDMTK